MEENKQQTQFSQDRQEIMELLKTTPRSIEEIKAFIKGENPFEERTRNSAN